MDCPHCRRAIHVSWTHNTLYVGDKATNAWAKTAVCPSCEKMFAKLGYGPKAAGYIIPKGTARAPVPPAVPASIAADYDEAALVLEFSPKASAALARRCLQNVLSAQGYTGRNLVAQVSAFISETDPTKVAPQSLRDTVDAVRNFGNFSAHPIDDKTTLQIVDVEDHEAEWCLDILDELFEHFYVRPAEAAAKKAALNAKLSAAGKPPAQ